MQHPDSESKSFLSSGWVVVLLMALSAAVGQAFGRFSYGVLLPAVRDDMGISNTLAGFIGGANVGAYLVGTLLVSWIAGRYRLLAIMRLGLLMVVAGLFGAAFSATPLAPASSTASRRATPRSSAGASRSPQSSACPRVWAIGIVGSDLSRLRSRRPPGTRTRWT